MKKILSFGEIIWDVFDGKSHIGGAALNFSLHTVRCGGECRLLSAVGRDALGDEALRLVKDFGVDTGLIKRSDKDTGRCIVSVDGEGVPSYEILDDVAYDNISLTDGEIEQIRKTSFDALYFGTLIQKEEPSCRSLYRLCREVAFPEIICDVNLRKNRFDASSIEFCLSRATVLKISMEEEPELRRLGLYQADGDCLTVAEAICGKYRQIKHLLLTCGSKGCFAYSAIDKSYFFEEAKKVEVASTVGAGDSFLGAFASAYLSGVSIREAVRIAVKVSAFVVSKTEAIPEYKLGDII